MLALGLKLPNQVKKGAAEIQHEEKKARGELVDYVDPTAHLPWKKNKGGTWGVHNAPQQSNPPNSSPHAPPKDKSKPAWNVENIQQPPQLSLEDELAKENPTSPKAAPTSPKAVKPAWGGAGLPKAPVELKKDVPSFSGSAWADECDDDDDDIEVKKPIQTTSSQPVSEIQSGGSRFSGARVPFSAHPDADRSREREMDPADSIFKSNAMSDRGFGNRREPSERFTERRDHVERDFDRNSYQRGFERRGFDDRSAAFDRFRGSQERERGYYDRERLMNDRDRAMLDRERGPPWNSSHDPWRQGRQGFRPDSFDGGRNLDGARHERESLEKNFRDDGQYKRDQAERERYQMDSSRDRMGTEGFSSRSAFVGRMHEGRSLYQPGPFPRGPMEIAKRLDGEMPRNPEHDIIRRERAENDEALQRQEALNQEVTTILLNEESRTSNTEGRAEDANPRSSGEHSDTRNVPVLRSEKQAQDRMPNSQHDPEDPTWARSSKERQGESSEKSTVTSPAKAPIAIMKRPNKVAANEAGDNEQHVQQKSETKSESKNITSMDRKQEGSTIVDIEQKGFPSPFFLNEPLTLVKEEFSNLLGPSVATNPSNSMKANQRPGAKQILELNTDPNSHPSKVDAILSHNQETSKQDIAGNNPGDKKVDMVPNIVDESCGDVRTETGRAIESTKRSQNTQNAGIQRYQPKQMRQRNVGPKTLSEATVEPVSKLPEQAQSEVTSGVNPPKELNSNERESIQGGKINKGGKFQKSDVKRHVVIQSVEGVIDSNNESQQKQSKFSQPYKGKQEKLQKGGSFHEIVPGRDVSVEQANQEQSREQPQRNQSQQQLQKSNNPKQPKQRPNSGNQRQQQHGVQESQVLTQSAQLSSEQSHGGDSKKQVAADERVKQQNIKMKQKTPAANGSSPSTTEGQQEEDQNAKQLQSHQSGKTNRDKQNQSSKTNSMMQYEQEGTRTKAYTPRNKSSKTVNVDQDRSEKDIAGRSDFQGDIEKTEENKALQSIDNRKKFGREKSKAMPFEQEQNSTRSKNVAATELPTPSAMTSSNCEIEEPTKQARHKERSIEHYVPPKLRQQRSQPKEQALEESHPDLQHTPSNAQADAAHKAQKNLEQKKHRKFNKDFPNSDHAMDGKLHKQEPTTSPDVCVEDSRASAQTEAGENYGEEGIQTGSLSSRVNFLCCEKQQLMSGSQGFRPRGRGGFRSRGRGGHKPAAVAT
eukprot:86907-Hanusia_phi.AAC.8